MLGLFMFSVLLVILLLSAIGYIFEYYSHKRKLKETEEMLKRAFKEVLKDESNDKKN